MISAWRQAVKKQSRALKDTMSAGAVDHLTSLLSRHFPEFSTVPGFHFLYCNPTNERLGNDGYDNYQAPVDSSGQPLFTRRMWVRGELQQHKYPNIGDDIRCTEQVRNVRSVGESVFVEIQRQLTTAGSPMVTENRWLMYTNEKQRRTDVHGQLPELPVHDETIELHVTDNDIARYSALTYNLHKIHLDRQYAHNEGFADLVLQGPYMVTLAMSYMKANGVDVHHFRYRNLQPCYQGKLSIGFVRGNDTRVDIFSADRSQHYFTGTVKHS